MLKHYNDGKQKWQSHEVYIDTWSDIPPGYGETYEEALHEFKKNVADHMQKIEILYNNLDSQEIIEVDCTGKPLK